MADRILFGDVLGDLKVWLVNHPLIHPLTGARIFFRMPKTNPTAPFLRLYRSGGGVNILEDTPIDTPRISIEIWGTTNTDYSALRGVELAIKSAFYQDQGLVTLNPDGSTMLLSGAVVTTIDAPDPDSGWPRVVCDVLLTTRVVA